MKTLQLILLCLPMIGFGQGNSTLEHSIIDTVFCEFISWNEMTDPFAVEVEFKSLTTIRDSLHFDIFGIEAPVKIQSEIESTLIRFDHIGLKASNFIDYNGYSLDQNYSNIYVIKYTVKKYKRSDYQGEGNAYSEVIVLGNMLIEFNHLDLDKVNPIIKEKLLKNKRELKQKEQDLDKKKLTKSTKDSLEIVYAVLSKWHAREDANNILVEKELQELLNKHKDEINLLKKSQELDFEYMIMMHNNIKENAKLFIIEVLESNLVTTEDLKEMLSKYSEKEIKLKNVKAYIEEYFIEKNKSENKFVGKWFILSKIVDIQRENSYLLIKDDGTCYSSDKPHEEDLSWSVKGNVFYLYGAGEDMSCSFNKEKTKLECDLKNGVFLLEKLDQ